MNEKKVVLVLAAHLDDEVLGAGGTIARHIAEGDDVYIHIVRDGIAERHGHANSREEATRMREVVKEDARKCAEVLGVVRENVSFGGYSLYDSFSTQHQLGQMSVSKNLEDVIDKVNPHIVYTHHHGDSHLDHKVVHDATMLATRAISRRDHRIQRVLAYEVPSSTDQMFQREGTVFLPNSYVDITPYIDRKLEAFSQYATEVELDPNPRSLPKLRAKAAQRGGEMNTTYAEAFSLLREFKRIDHPIRE